MLLKANRYCHPFNFTQTMLKKIYIFLVFHHKFIAGPCWKTWKFIFHYLPHVHVLSLLEEARELGENPRTHKENRQTPHRPAPESISTENAGKTFQCEIKSSKNTVTVLTLHHAESSISVLFTCFHLTRQWAAFMSWNWRKKHENQSYSLAAKWEVNTEPVRV